MLTINISLKKKKKKRKGLMMMGNPLGERWWCSSTIHPTFIEVAHRKLSPRREPTLEEDG